MSIWVVDKVYYDVEEPKVSSDKLKIGTSEDVRIFSANFQLVTTYHVTNIPAIIY